MIIFKILSTFKDKKKMKTIIKKQKQKRQNNMKVKMEMIRDLPVILENFCCILP